MVSAVIRQIILEQQKRSCKEIMCSSIYCVARLNCYSIYLLAMHLQTDANENRRSMLAKVTFQHTSFCILHNNEIISDISKSYSYTFDKLKGRFRVKG
jgi:hypothetical protein